MTQIWEYKYVDLNQLNVEEELSKLGEEGWEAVGFAHDSDPDMENLIQVLLKRPRET